MLSDVVTLIHHKGFRALDDRAGMGVAGTGFSGTGFAGTDFLGPGLFWSSHVCLVPHS